MTIEEKIKDTIKLLKDNNIEDSAIKAKLILANLLNKPKEYLITHNLDSIQEEIEEEYNKNIEELIKGKPLQYIIGKQEFMGIEFEVNENVLIPQPDTEILVEEVIKIANRIENPQILDLCTGSGAIAVSLSKTLENAEIVASDISKQALEIAKRNDKQKKVKFLHSDLFNSISGKFDIIVSNPPYIKTDDIKKLSKEVQNEPEIALDGGNDGLDFYRRILNTAYKYLKPNGYLCLEIGNDQKNEIIAIIKQTNHYEEINAYKDLGRNDRVITCKV